MGDECDYEDYGEPKPYESLVGVELELRETRILLTECEIKALSKSVFWNTMWIGFLVIYTAWDIHECILGVDIKVHSTAALIEILILIWVVRSFNSARFKLRVERDELKKLKQ